MQGLLKINIHCPNEGSKLSFHQEQTSRATSKIEEAEWVLSSSCVENGKELIVKLECNPVEADGYYFDEDWTYTADLYLKINARDTRHESLDHVLNPEKNYIEYQLNSEDFDSHPQKSHHMIGMVIIMKDLKGLKRKKDLDFTKKKNMPFSDMEITLQDGTTAYIHKAIAGFNSPFLLKAANKINEAFSYKDEMENVLRYWYDKKFEINKTNVEKMYGIADYFCDEKLIHDCRNYLIRDKTLTNLFILNVASSRNNPVFFKDILNVIGYRENFKESAESFRDNGEFEKLCMHIKCDFLLLLTKI